MCAGRGLDIALECAGRGPIPLWLLHILVLLLPPTLEIALPLWLLEKLLFLSSPQAAAQAIALESAGRGPKLLWVQILGTLGAQ